MQMTVVDGASRWFQQKATQAENAAGRNPWAYEQKEF